MEPPPTGTYTYGHTLSLPDALPISDGVRPMLPSIPGNSGRRPPIACGRHAAGPVGSRRDAEDLVDGKPAVFEADCGGCHVQPPHAGSSSAEDRKSTRLNSSH